MNRLTDRMNTVLREARELADSWGHNYVGTEHVLYALASRKESVAGAALSSLGVEPEALRKEIGVILGFDPEKRSQKYKEVQRTR